MRSVTSHRLTQGAVIAFVIGALLRMQVTSTDNHEAGDFGPSWAMFGVAAALGITGVVLWVIDRSKSTTASELEHLADLHERGQLTDDEFAAAKRRLLE